MPRRFLAGTAPDAGGRTTLVVTLGFEGALFLFTDAGFRQAVGLLETQPFAGPEKRNLQRLFFSKAERIDLDEKNRMLLPSELLRLVGIDRDVVLVGCMERAEIWPKDKWEAFQAEHGRDFERLDRELVGGEAPRA